MKAIRLLGTLLILLLTSNSVSATAATHENNSWYQYNNSDTVVIFVHGIFSNSEECWTATNGMYWPAMLNEDTRFPKPSIYLAGYETNVSSGIFGINAASESMLSYLGVSDPAKHPSPLDKPNIIFVAHSTGGLVTMYLLDRHKELFSNKKVGLVLLASPSRGSAWSNRLKWIRTTFGNRMAGQLARDNDFIQDLDLRFSDLVSKRQIPNLAGIDAFENKFIIRFLFLFNRTHVVTASDAASYFGAYRIIPNTDHFSISKPTSLTHPSYQLLYEFYEKRFVPITIPVSPVAPAPQPARHIPPVQFKVTGVDDSIRLTLNGRLLYDGGTVDWTALPISPGENQLVAEVFNQESYTGGVGFLGGHKREGWHYSLILRSNGSEWPYSDWTSQGFVDTRKG